MLRNPTPRALVLVHPEPQSDVERDLVSQGRMSLAETANYDIFRRIEQYLDRYKDKYDYLVYLPVEHYRTDEAVWNSPLVPPGIKKYQDLIDVINEPDLETQAEVLKRILYLKKIPSAHLGGLSRNCCVRDIAYWLVGRGQEVGFIPDLRTPELRRIAPIPFKVRVLPALTD